MRQRFYGSYVISEKNNFMKKLSLAVLMIGFVFLGGSCNKDSNGNTIYKMSASIDGKQWSTLTALGELSSGVLVITGVSSTGESIAVTVYGETKGSYTISVLPPMAQCLGTYKATISQTSVDTYVSTTGKVLITKLDKTNKLASGTFEFTLINTVNMALPQKQITVGAFTDVTFIIQ